MWIQSVAHQQVGVISPFHSIPSNPGLLRFGTGFSRIKLLHPGAAAQLAAMAIFLQQFEHPAVRLPVLVSVMVLQFVITLSALGTAWNGIGGGGCGKAQVKILPLSIVFPVFREMRWC